MRYNKQYNETNLAKEIYGGRPMEPDWKTLMERYAVWDDRVYTEDDLADIPEDVFVELLEGTIYFKGVPALKHQGLVSELIFVIRSYIKGKGGRCKVYPDVGVRLFEDAYTIAKPDVSVICDQNKLSDEGIIGAPDWVIEIVSPGNAKHDYIRKLELYTRAGVREYWIVDPRTEEVHVYNMDNGFDMKSYGYDEKIPAGIYEDLIIDMAALEP